jgi:formate/nitrite transporter FocA (FNT family)
MGKGNQSPMPRPQPALPAVKVAEPRRPTAAEIFEAAVDNARTELRRSWRAQMFSGVAGGITMGLTAIGVASVRALLGDGGWQQLVSYIIYPTGFIAVIIGRQQLFTENTLYPVVLVLQERKHLSAMLKLWGIVFPSNIVGALIFATLAIHTTALMPAISMQITQLGVGAIHGNFGHLFWSGVVGGWLIALVAWMVTASGRLDRWP